MRREQALIRLLAAAAPDNKLLNAAEQLRLARLRLLNDVRVTEIPGKRTLKMIAEETDLWSSLSLEQIIDSYRNKKPFLKLL